MLSDHMDEKVEKVKKAAELEDKEKMEAFLENANIFRLARPAEKSALNAATVGNKESSDTHTLLAAEFIKLYTRWRATEEPNEAVVLDRECHEVMSPERLQAASRTFKQTTATSLEGIHPRHIGMLCEQGAHVTALLQCCHGGCGYAACAGPVFDLPAYS